VQITDITVFTQGIHKRMVRIKMLLKIISPLTPAQHALSAAGTVQVLVLLGLATGFLYIYIYIHTHTNTLSHTEERIITGLQWN
jgi:hypothetical protein